MSGHASDTLTPLHIAVLTVSDTRDESTDTSGGYLVEQAKQAGHKVVAKAICVDDKYKLRAQLSQWIADDNIQIVLSTGGTGFTARDTTPEAFTPLFDRTIEGFGELFRQISYNEIGTSTIQSRAFAGFANGTAIFCMPGSTNACKTAWTGILQEQLDSRHRPCNFAPHVAPVPTNG